MRRWVILATTFALLAAGPASAPRDDGSLFITSFDTDSVPRYDGGTGAFLDEFIPRHAGGLVQPYGLLFGPLDGNLYVTSGQFGGQGQVRGVLRYDGDTGAFLGIFAGRGVLNSPRGIIFGPEGDLYVSDQLGPARGRIVRFHGLTGAFLGEFVPAGSGGMDRPQGLVFGPDLHLYVCSAETNNVLRFDGLTGAFLGEFVPAGSGGMDHPTGLTFGPDGHLYVANTSFGVGNTAVLRFRGPLADFPGSPLPSQGGGGADFIPAGSGGLLAPFGLLFGPDVNGDGLQDLYVNGSRQTDQNLRARDRTSTVKRYDGRSGAFLDTFVTASHSFDNPSLMTFRQTDPSTLEFIDRR